MATKTLRAEDVAGIDMPQQSSDLLVAARKLLAQARDKSLEAEDLEQRAAALRGEVSTIRTVKLVDLLRQAGITSLTLEPEGNTPGYSAELKPFYRAGISAEWPLDKQQAGFDYLESLGSGDLVKRLFTVDVGRDEKMAGRVRKALEKVKAEFSEGRSVHHGTLTAWLKETHKKTGELPKLDLIGGTVGQVVDIKPTKEKK